jgi:SAM-dependent methyltransferase
MRRKTNTIAFGVEPGYEPYRLRQSRYQALGEDVARFALEIHKRDGRRVDLLDVGVGRGVTRMYSEVHAGAEHINFHAADCYPRGREIVYKHEQWQHYRIDAENGLPELDSERFDIVVCEQMLEHLHNSSGALAELVRVLKPGGRLFVGVPTFPHGPHLIRKHVVPLFDRWTDRKPRQHVQAFSKRSFLQMLHGCCDVEVLETRGFRIISGGILRPLEYCRWWWRLNRRIGAIVPGLCVEIQVVATKPLTAASAARRSDTQRAA